MRHLPLIFLLAVTSASGFAQGTGGIQFSGALAANLIDDFNANQAYIDSNAGNTYLQLNATLREGPFGFDSQVQIGPSGNAGSPTQTQNVFYHYGYGYANFFGNSLYIAIGRLVDVDSFGLSSAYLQSTDGPGVYGNAPGKLGSTGFGFNGGEIRVTPVPGLLIGVLVPYQVDPFPIVNSTLRGTKMEISYTVQKAAQVVVGYQQHVIGVADYVIPSAGIDPNSVLGENKLFALVNLLVSEDIVAGARYELDHNLSPLTLYGNNAYITLGAKLGDAWLGVDGGLFAPSDATPGFEVLATAYYTVHLVPQSVDFQPAISAGFFNSNYPVVTFESGVTTTGRNGDNRIIVNPELKLLLGKSQHELVLGYTLTMDLDTGSILLNQLNVLAEFFF
jgi:hypothetical protein